MTKEEAKDFLINISYKLSNMAIEYLTEKDGEKMREAIKALEYPTGYWITGRGTYYDVEIYRCSECKSLFAYKAEECPNCHARMVGEKE